VALTVALGTIVPNVVGSTQAVGGAAIAAAGLTVGSVTTSGSTSPAGTILSQAPPSGSTENPGTAIALTVSLGPPAAQVTVSADGTGTRTTPVFSTTTAGEVLVAFAASDGPTAGANTQNLTISGAGLTWTRVQRAATQRGDSEIWTARAPSALSNVTVTSTQSVTTVNGGPVNQSLTVVAYTAASGIGGSAVASGATGAPRVTLITQGTGSLVYGVGNDFDRGIARTVPAGQTKIHEFLAPTGDTMWVQALNGTTLAAGSSVALNDTAPTADQWNFASVEVMSGAPPATVTVPGVTGVVQVIAQAAITAAGLVPIVTTANSATVPSGQVISQTPAAGASALTGSSVALVVSLGPAPAAPTAQITVSSDGTGVRTTPAFSTTTPGEVLVAFAASDGPTTGANTQNLTVSGAGLTWTRVQRAATQRGDSEIWTATAPAVLTNVTVTSAQSVTTVLGAPVNQSLTVVAFTNASAVGASNVGGAVIGAPSIGVVAQAAGSAVYAIGNDFDRAVARTIPPGQTKIHEFLAPTGDTFWVQALAGLSSASGATVTLNATAPTADQWNFAIVEIKR
jgi:beta-lactam-binding protein with PASTA domain